MLENIGEYTSQRVPVKVGESSRESYIAVPEHGEINTDWERFHGSLRA
jgi:hypothetical protein